MNRKVDFHTSPDELCGAAPSVEFLLPIISPNTVEVPWVRPEHLQLNAYHTSQSLTESRSEERDIEGFMNLLNEERTFNKILSLAKSKYSEGQKFIFQRLRKLKKMVEDEDTDSLSLPSLKGLLLFLYSIEDFSNPTITANDSGYLQINWKKDRRHLLTLNFKEDYLLHYVIFKPSRHADKRIISNGSMDIIDFKNEIDLLGITFHRKIK